MNDQSLRQGKAASTPEDNFFSREKEELPQVRFQTRDVLHTRQTLPTEPPRQFSWAGRTFKNYARAKVSLLCKQSNSLSVLLTEAVD